MFLVLAGVDNADGIDSMSLFWGCLYCPLYVVLCKPVSPSGQTKGIPHLHWVGHIYLRRSKNWGIQFLKTSRLDVCIHCVVCVKPTSAFILQDFPDVALDIQEKSGIFYRVKAEMIELKFSTQPVAPSRPPPPTNPAPQSGKTRSSSSSSDGHGRTKFQLFHHRNSGNSGKAGFV